TLVDGICYPTAQALPPKPPVDIGGCSVWPCTTMTSGGTGSENSLADVAQYYYKTDLRPTMIDNVPSAGTGVEDDNAPHQHMTTFTIGLGVSGTLVYNPDYRSLATTTGDFADIRTGAKGWPLWPDPMLDYADFTNYNNPKSIDDFWHTAVDGRGRFFSANDPTSVVQGLGDALAKIDDVVASGTADSVSTLQPTSTNNFAYSTSYKSGVWQGDVESRTIDVSSGIPGPTVWSAKDLLGPRELATCDAREIRVLHGGATPTLTNFALGTNLCPTRVPPGTLTTTMDAVDQPFFGLASLSQLSQWALMSPAQQAAALADPGALVNFLRGQRASEGYVYNSATKFFRQRGEGIAGEGILGDIVDSQPVYVGEPFASYQENDYAGFKASRGAREPMIYVGANDGMLHAFYASLTATYGGQEAWAVIPSVLVPNLYKLADVNYKRDGHQFYVDGTPVVGDVWDGTNWRTILVGGLGAGGKGYYALDVTVPGVLPTPKWEFKLDLASCPAGSATAFAPNLYYGDCNLGLTFGKPVITKLAGQWVVMFTSGYNNGNGAATGDGVGFLYVVNALNGSLLYKIPTTGGTPGTPSGLAQINNYVDNVLLDNTTLRVYGGDVLGQMWRFDFLPSATATLLGTAKDLATATIEPITVRPELAELDGKPFVMFGTGKLLGSSDVTDSQKQSVYGLRDPLIGSSPIYPDPLRNSLKPMQVAQTGTGATAVRTISCTGSAGDCGRPAGFVLDLAEAGERVNVEMKLVLGALVFSSNVPEAVPCSVGGHSWFNQIDFSTGAPIPGAVTSQYLSDSINVGFNVLQLPPPPGSTNPQYVGLFRQSKATDLERQVTPPEPLPQGKRISWREIAQ
ncbi:MAG TPA: PilC/PilY family type IV pilus protein, partial [Caldimonas sp.]